MDGTKYAGSASSSGTPVSPILSDADGEVAQEEHGGDYSARLEEVMSDEEDSQNAHVLSGNEEDEDDRFIYDGVDSPPSVTYRDQLRDVLGTDHEEDANEQHTINKFLVDNIQEKEKYEAAMDDEARVRVPTRPQTMRCTEVLRSRQNCPLSHPSDLSLSRRVDIFHPRKS